MRTTKALLTVAMLLALATSASAECAWVLWTHILAGAPTDPRWSFQKAVETLDECRRERTKTIALMSDLWAPPSSIHGHATDTGVAYDGVDERGQKWAYSHVYECIPATIDPREPKGTR